MLSANAFNLDQSKILPSGNGLKVLDRFSLTNFSDRAAESAE